MPVLVVVERAHRGRLEQQHAHVLWLVEALARQHPTDVLLRGSAAGYAVAAPPVPPLRLGGVEVPHPPDYPETVGRLTGSGVRVLVATASLAALGLAGRELLAGVEPVADPDVPGVCAAYDRIWYL